MAKKHQCTAYYAHHVRRKLFGIELPLTMALVVRCEQREGHTRTPIGDRDIDALHDAANPDNPSERLKWKERVAD